MTLRAFRDIFDAMKRSLYIVLISLVLLALALGGWAVDGVRWLTRGSRRPRLAAA
jgi:hypothetical protein